IQHIETPIPTHRPDAYIYDIRVRCDEPREFTLKLRIPWWVQGEPQILLNGEQQATPLFPPLLRGDERGVGSFATLRRVWQDDRIRLILPKALTVEPLPDRPDMVAFMDGPLVLAGLTD